MPDKTLKCRDCGCEFVFSESEQQFFAQKGFTNDPIRCHECRASRRARRGEGGTSSARPDREMYPAVCAQCGKATQVPFQPRSDRPVYCSECYSTVRGSSSSGGSSYGGRSSGGMGGGGSRDRRYGNGGGGGAGGGGGRDRNRW